MVRPDEVLQGFVPMITDMFFGIMIVMTPGPLPPMSFVDNMQPYVSKQACLRELNGLYEDYFLHPDATGNADGIPLIKLPHEIRCRTYEDWQKEPWSRDHIMPLLRYVYQIWEEKQVPRRVQSSDSCTSLTAPHCREPGSKGFVR